MKPVETLALEPLAYCQIRYHPVSPKVTISLEPEIISVGKQATRNSNYASLLRL